jgi:hypothetical protein
MPFSGRLISQFYSLRSLRILFALFAVKKYLTAQQKMDLWFELLGINQIFIKIKKIVLRQ